MKTSKSGGNFMALRLIIKTCNIYPLPKDKNNKYVFPQYILDLVTKKLEVFLPYNDDELLHYINLAKTRIMNQHGRSYTPTIDEFIDRMIRLRKKDENHIRRLRLFLDYIQLFIPIEFSDTKSINESEHIWHNLKRVFNHPKGKQINLKNTDIQSKLLYIIFFEISKNPGFEENSFNLLEQFIKLAQFFHTNQNLEINTAINISSEILHFNLDDDLAYIYLSILKVLWSYGGNISTN